MRELSNQDQIKQFDDYISRLTSGLELEEEEKSELEEEWKLHLYDHFTSLIKNGMNQEKAVRTAIEQFGDISMIQNEVNQTYPNAIKRHVQKEILIAIVCMIASMIGPMILIGAHFNANFIILPLQALLVAYLIHRFIISRQTDWRLSIIGIAVIYLFFLRLPYFMGTSFSIELYIDQLFSLDWDRLTGSSGLFEFVTIHMLWYVVVAFKLFSNENYIPVWKRVINASFQYWAMAMIAVFLARFQSSGEGAVLYLNVFLLYAFLHQTISINGIVIFKEKMVRRLLRQYF